LTYHLEVQPNVIPGDEGHDDLYDPDHPKVSVATFIVDADIAIDPAKLGRPDLSCAYVRQFGTTLPDMPMIRVEMYPGRTPEQKANLVREVTDAFVRTCGGNPGGVWVVINEVPREHWGVGGELGSVSERPVAGGR